MIKSPPIPSTSPTRDLSGMAALNLPSPNGTGDWHMVETFFRPKSVRSRSFVVGEGCEVNTLPFLGNAGIFECSAILSDIGVSHPGRQAYAATHARAIVDMIIGAILAGQSPNFIGLDDWMSGESDKKEVFDLLNNAKNKLARAQQGEIEKWITANST